MKKLCNFTHQPYHVVKGPVVTYAAQYKKKSLVAPTIYFNASEILSPWMAENISYLMRLF